MAKERRCDMAEVIQAYKPKCCNKAYMYKGNAIQHEKKCPYNPDNKACQTCKHRSVYYETVYNRHHNGNPGSTDYEIKCWWCEHFEKEINKYAEMYGENTNKIAPKKNCEYWEQKEE